ncbi:MAG: DNA mismatch repair protein MutS [candidate division Zixibacteria bacterium 4484_95]|nr:MAG: DNA mismatch repair protein MutS [candidate division Zixibacteria bacterium 4484_95]
MPDKTTPLLKQYFKIKEQYPDRILFFRMGDFYEMFGDDAKIASEVLGITLTSRNHGKSGKIPLAGVPYHQAEKYLAGLLKAGYGVVVCEQVEDPKLAKGLVKRDVVEVLTPGSITVEGVLEEGATSFIASIFIENKIAGIALLDYTTGEFILDQVPTSHLELTISRYQPSELLVPENYSGSTWNIPFYRTELFRYDKDFAGDILKSHFGTASLDGFGVSDMPLAIGAAGALLDYIKKLKKGQVDHLRSFKRASGGKEMYLDQATIANLELIESSSGDREFSLLWLLDRCHTAMGKRALRRRLVCPLTNKNDILDRQKKIVAFYEDRTLSDDVIDILKDVRDIERILSRFVAGRATPRDLAALRDSLIAILRLKERLKKHAEIFFDLTEKIDNFDDILPQLKKALMENPPVSYLEGGIFRKGYSEELDRLRSDISEAQSYIKNLQMSERKRTSIPSLKVGFNKVFGYFIEVTKPHLSKVPKDYIRKQTLVNAERFITEKMKIKEELILKAEEKINLLEAELFLELKGKVKEISSRILTTASAVADIDFSQSLASVARVNYYCLPEIIDIDEGESVPGIIDIKAGRHPIVEKSLPPGEFVPNDTFINTDDRRIQIITGPNMAGKSTYLRQVGLIVIMAQMGGFVPADYAVISIVDRVFTRVGAADRLSQGQSTFMLEMSETSNIINNATPKSLILLDELGRGTSTYDGLSLAWAVAEHICENPKIASRTLFATHYHELTEMASLYQGIINLQVTVKEYEDKIIFLRKIIPGGCDDSYGIEVARLAGLPGKVINKAKKILEQLEDKKPPEIVRKKMKKSKPEVESYQISLFTPQESKIAERLRNIDIDNLTPLEALKILQEFKGEL